MAAPPSQIPELRRDALNRLDGIVHELTIAMLNRQIFQAVRDELATRRPTTDATFINSYSGVYARAQVMVVRRLADDHHDEPDSLWWLIQRIKRNPGIASRQLLIERVRSERRDEIWLDDALRHEYARMWGTGDVPNEAQLTALQTTITDELAKVLDYADKNVAHRDPRGPMFTLTYSDLHAALDRLAELVNLVCVMLKSEHTMYDDIIIEGDWHECFRPGLFPIPIEAFAYPHPGGFA